MDNLITLIDSLTIFPLWADIIFLLLAVAIGIAILKLAIGIVIFLVTAFIGFVMLVVGGAVLLIASIIEKLDD
jgi:hypothetical protein